MAAIVIARDVAAIGDEPSVPAPFDRLIRLHTPLGKRRPGDWLERHHESGQTYRQYVSGRPIRAIGRRRTLYIQPLGDFTADQRKIITLAADFEGIYFQLPVRLLPDLPLSAIPEQARRTHPEWGTPQILSTYVLDRLLKPRLPADAVALIAFTSSDLWPGEGWNFVFGQASLGDRVGVWSIHRFGKPAAGDEAFRTTLRRTLKTAVHETGHMFLMAHCIYYDCAMCGSNHLEEADRRPLWLCPICLGKLCYATGADPKKRFKDLIEFANQQGFAEDEQFWRKSLEALRTN